MLDGEYIGLLLLDETQLGFVVQLGVDFSEVEQIIYKDSPTWCLDIILMDSV